MIKFLSLLFISTQSLAAFSPQTVITDAASGATAHVESDQSLDVTVIGGVSSTVNQGTAGSSPWLFALPTGASSSSLQTIGNASLASILTALGSPFQSGGSIANTAFGVSGTLPAFASTPTFNLGTLNGAATASNQVTAQTSLSSIDSKLTSPLTVTATQATAANLNATVVQGTGTNLHTVVDSGSVTVSSTKAPINSTGSGTAGTVSTVITLSAPSNAVGFVLMNMDTSTANLRWAVGRTATTTVGQQLQPGRSSDFVSVGADVSLVAESGTQNYDIQWISQ